MKVRGHMKNIAFFVLAIFAVLSMTSVVEAQSANYDIVNIEIDDIVLDPATAGSSVLSYDVERGQRLDIEVTIRGEVNGSVVDDVVVDARIFGYEFGSIIDTTEQFSVEPGRLYKKRLTLLIPEDIDASEEHTLRIEVSDPLDNVERQIRLFIDEPRHNLRVFDVLLNPSSTITAGNPVFVTVRLENLGEKEQNDIKVTASIPALGIQTVNFIDELNTEEQEEGENNGFNIRQDNSKQLDLLLRVPDDALSGTYDLNIDVEYNRGHSFLTETLLLNVEGTGSEGGVQTLVNADSTSKVVMNGDTAEYRVMIANLGEEPGVYSVQVDGVSSWGEATVQPGFLTVMPDSTGEIAISVNPFDTDETASRTWVARVMVGTQVVNELTFTTKVDAGETTVMEDTEEPKQGNSLRAALAILFGVLVVILIVLGVVIAFRRMQDQDGEDNDEVVEGQTYY